MITLKHHLNFGTNFSRSNFCDANLKTKSGDGCIAIHRNILSAVSKKLEKRFEDNLDNSEPIVINNVDFDVLEKIITYVYTGQITFASEDIEYEDFCDGMLLLKMNLGNEEKISPETNASQVVVKMEYEEESLVEDQDTAAKSPTTSAPMELMLPVPSTNTSSVGSGVPVRSDLTSSTHSNIGSSDGGHLNPTNIQVLPDLSNRYVSNGFPGALSRPISSDINSNLDIKIRTDLFNAREEPTDEIEVLGVKKLVELFLEELSDRISTREIKNYFSAFGEVDLMENIYGRNSGLGIVEIK